MDRRAFLGSAAIGAVSLAGCSGLAAFRTVLLDDGSYPQVYYDSANTNHTSTTGPDDAPKRYWEHDGNHTQPFVANGNVYLRNLTLDASDGSEVWSPSVGNHFRSVDDETVYGVLNTDDGDVLAALNGETGEVQWQVDPPGDAFSYEGSRAGSRLFVYTSWDDGTGNARKRSAFDAETGEHLWTPSIGEDMDYPVAVSDETVFVCDSEAGLLALDVDDGSIGWSRDDATYLQAPSVADGRVFALSEHDSERGITAVDADSGSNLWNRRLGVWRPVAATGQTVYLTVHPDIGPRRDLSAARLVALDAETGETRWEQDTGVSTTPTLADGTLYVGGRTEARTGMVAAFDASTGERLWEFSRTVPYDGDVAPDPTVSVTIPVVVDGFVFVSIGDTLYALGD